MTYRHAGIAAVKQMKHARDAIWLAIVVHFVSIKIGNNIIRHVEQMQHARRNRQHKKLRHLRRHRVHQQIQIQIALHVHRQLIRVHQRPSQPWPLMGSLRHPSDGISWWSPKRNIYASHLEKVSSQSDIESQKNFQKKRIKIKWKWEISPGCTIYMINLLKKYPLCTHTSSNKRLNFTLNT